MKNLLYTLSAFYLFSACNSPVNKGQVIPLRNDSIGAVGATDSVQPLTNPIILKDSIQYYNACNAFFDSLLLSKGTFNGSILVAKNGNIIYEKYAGYINPLNKKDSISINSPFHLASVSKTFTAMAVLKLWEQGRLSLEDSLGKFFPNFPYKGITLKMLLNHRSGLPNYVHYLEEKGWDKRKMVNNVDVLTSLYLMRPSLESVSGKHFSYCNTNYALLALVIEKATGVTYANFLQQTFFAPLQMKDTYVYSLKDTARAMPSFKWNNIEYRMEFLDQVYGDKNIYSTVRDMLKWDQALYAGQLFKQSTLDSAFAGYSFEKQGKRNYGLGWRITFLDNGKKLLYHNGWWHGNNTAFTRLVDEKVTIIVLGNKFNQRIYASKKLSDVFGNYFQNGGAHNTEDNEGNNAGGGEPEVKNNKPSIHHHPRRSHHRR